VVTRLRQPEAATDRLTGEESVGNLNQDARAVARLRIAAAGASMRQILQNFDTLQHDFVRSITVDIYDKADSAGIMFVGRVVQTSCRGELIGVSGRIHFSLLC